MDDLDAVLDAAGSPRAALIGAVEAGLCAMYAATHPDRVSALVLANVGVAGGLVLDDERREQMLDLIENHWGEGRFLELFAPEPRGRPALRGLVGALRALVDESLDGAHGSSTCNARSTSAACCRRSACRRSSCTGATTRWSRWRRGGRPRR